MSHVFTPLLFTVLLALPTSPTLDLTLEPTPLWPDPDPVITIEPSADNESPAQIAPAPQQASISRIPRTLERAHEIFDNTGEVNGIVDHLPANSFRPTTNRNHALYTPAYIFIASVLGLLAFLGILTTAQYLTMRHRPIFLPNTPHE